MKNKNAYYRQLFKARCSCGLEQTPFMDEVDHETGIFLCASCQSPVTIENFSSKLNRWERINEEEDE